MATRAQTLIPIFIAAVIVGIIGILTIPSDSKLESTEFPIGMISINDKIISVQIADNKPRQARGLMFQEQLEYDEGMFFVFDKLENHNIWMPNMQFPIDIMWLDNDGRIIDIEKDVPACKTALETLTCPEYGDDSLDSKYVLEVTAGFVEKFAISIGEIVDIISI